MKGGKGKGGDKMGRGGEVDSDVQLEQGRRLANAGRLAKAGRACLLLPCLLAV